MEYTYLQYVFGFLNKNNITIWRVKTIDSHRHLTECNVSKHLCEIHRLTFTSEAHIFIFSRPFSWFSPCFPPGSALITLWMSGTIASIHGQPARAFPPHTCVCSFLWTYNLLRHELIKANLLPAISWLLTHAHYHALEFVCYWVTWISVLNRKRWKSQAGCLLCVFG